MMWLRREMAKRDMQQPPAPSPIENNPVGWSSIYPPQVATNASPDFSPLADPGQFTNEQRLGAFWNLATRRAKPWTNRDLPQLSEAANEAYDAAGGFVGMSTPIRAYHGSPHTFDRFDLSKIGTGEGAQAYGHGLYFAGNEKVARSYRDTLTPPGMRVTAPDGGSVIATPGSAQFYKPLVESLKNVPGESYIKQALARAFSEGADDLSAATIKNAFGDMALSADDAAKVKQNVDKLIAKSKPILSSFKIERPGSMYEVNLRTSPERLLDWDKPLSQQPAAVREALGKIGIAGATPKPYNGMPLGNGGTLRVVEDPDFGPKMFMDLASGTSFRINESDLANLIGKQGSEMFGKTAYTSAAAKSGGDAAASQALRDVGIDGLQYLDAGSRAAGDGSRNYVMFRDDIIDILKRYGLFGLGMVGGATAGPYGADNP